MIKEYNFILCEQCFKVFQKSERLLKHCGSLATPIVIIRSWCLSNTTSLNVYYIDYSCDQLIAGINKHTPENYQLMYDEEEDSSYILFGCSRYYLNECMRV